ncbi:DUF1059 domain-containing protein [Euzebya tangerina]|uniref:DUF1059 domain-containing protein n=1 Tax=Euzebya tangerina TaxID=591198 RepID=UPI0013C2EF48|nr:DUF1059 domain-containing protein [Euzebya tangerina]
MKKFACGDVVPGCDATFEGETVQAILSQVGIHARDGHGINQVTDDLIQSVTDNIH